MGEYFGFDIGERDEGDWQDYLNDIDPKYHVVLTHAMADMCDWYGDKDYRQIDQWFTILYGLVLELESVLECTKDHGKVELPFDIWVKDD